MFKFIAVPQAKKNIVITDMGLTYVKIDYSVDVDVELLMTLLEPFGSVFNDKKHSIDLFINPVFDKQEIFTFINELYN